MLIISTGIRPCNELAASVGLNLCDRGGIVVNENMQTSDSDIYAIGEVASVDGKLFGLVGPGYDMADIAASHILTKDVKKKEFDTSTRLKLLGVDVASIGQAKLDDDSCDTFTLLNTRLGVYKRLNISKDGKKLLGAILVGDLSEYSLFLQVFKNGLALPEQIESLLVSSPSQEQIIIPESAVVCSCNNVTKGEILKAITENELFDLNSVKVCSKAGSGCGGCLSSVDKLLKDKLLDMGHVINNSICEHFNYSREELYNIVKINQVKTFAELLENYGCGSGCEKCKPAIASIFAGIYNETAIKDNTIQDTNDRFLANIQKNGTYSVIPRIPGGEINPDKLIVLAGVARRHNLYLKITGAQRLAMFGARLNDLPDIWEDLTNAGFESGHAYAKGMRAVKSCVGSTWCRYGMKDSASLAIKIENRYKGIRTPHKFKSAVSGCLRQCAEVDNKDFGLIATEKGWNLYVAGNGGAKPQGAKLLVNDLDEITAIRYIDRYLMYYIQTAQPLVRTSTWFNSLEGGIEYLCEVIIHDKLGICEQLEKDMQDLVDAYTCEWKALLNDSEKRFWLRHFANSDDHD